MFAYYHDCDPIKSRQVDKKDQLFPLFVMQVMGDIPGVPGLFVAGVFSGALSTVSSGLNSLAAVCLKDFFGSGCNLKLSEDRAALVTKLLAVVFGVIGYGIVFLVKYLPGVLEAALGIFGIVGGPVLGAFTLGMFFPFANSIVRGSPDFSDFKLNIFSIREPSSVVSPPSYSPCGWASAAPWLLKLKLKTPSGIRR